MTTPPWPLTWRPKQLGSGLWFWRRTEPEWFALNNRDGTYANKSTFRGRPGESAPGVPAVNGIPSSDQLSIAPAIEYNINDVSGFIGGGWFAVTGRNSPNFASVIISYTIMFWLKKAHMFGINAFGLSANTIFKLPADMHWLWATLPYIDIKNNLMVLKTITPSLFRNTTSRLIGFQSVKSFLIVPLIKTSYFSSIPHEKPKLYLKDQHALASFARLLLAH